MPQENSSPHLSVAEAQEKILASLYPVETESIPIKSARRRILAEVILSSTDLPSFPNSSMDGFAVKAFDIEKASLDNPVVLEVIADIPAGIYPTIILKSGQAARIMTGAVLPDGADAVIPVEETDQFLDGRQFKPTLSAFVKIFKGISPGDNVRPKGKDLRKNDVVLRPGRHLMPQDIGLLAMLGIGEIQVYRRPKIAMISTGDELVPLGEALKPGKIHDSNAYTLSAQIERDGGEPHYLGIAEDNEDSISNRLDQAYDLKANLILSTAGVSVGAFDYVKRVVEENGESGFWRVNIRPGKPLLFGHYRGIPFIGLPGNPVSAFVGYEVFIRPAIQKLSGGKIQKRQTTKVVLAEDIESDGRESYLRGYIEKQSGILKARLTGHQGSGNLLSLVQANALLIIPSEVKSLPSGAEVEAWLIGEVDEISY
jgi:molybdopterin molybdotransferase